MHLRTGSVVCDIFPAGMPRSSNGCQITGLSGNSDQNIFTNVNVQGSRIRLFTYSTDVSISYSEMRNMEQ